MGGATQAAQSLIEDKIHIRNQSVEPPVAQDPSVELRGKKGSIVSTCIFMLHMELPK